MHEDVAWDLPQGEEIEVSRGVRIERVRIERRSFLELSAFGLAVPLAHRFVGEDAASPSALLTYEQFLAEAVPQARALVKDMSRAGEDRYLLSLAALAVRLTNVPVPEMRDTTSDPKAKAHTFIGANDGGDPFVVLHWRLDPGARIGLHPHTYGNVVTLGLEGEARIENYEMEGAPDFDTEGPFRVRRTCDQILRPGDVNLVPLEHGYVHGFVAGPSGARGLDITTRVKEKRRNATLIVGAKPIDAARAIYEGRWKHD